MTNYIVKNEDDAWKLLAKILAEGVPDGPFEFTFDQWPILEFKLKGDKFNSSLTTKVMQSFIDLQQNINRSYAYLRYNKPTSRSLSVDQKTELEIVVKVEKGSSLFKVDLQPAAETLLQGVMGKMTGTEIVISVLGVALVTGGVICVKAYFENRREERQIDIIPLLSNQETKRFEIFAQAMQKHEKLRLIYDDAQETYDSMIRGASEAEYLEIGGQKIPQEVAVELIRQKRSRSTEVQLNGNYRILKVDSSKPDGFMIDVRSEVDNRVFTAKLEDKWVHRRDANLELLKDAEWGKAPIYLKINGKELRGEISQATILDVGKES